MLPVIAPATAFNNFNSTTDNTDSSGSQTAVRSRFTVAVIPLAAAHVPPASSKPIPRNNRRKNARAFRFSSVVVLLSCFTQEHFPCQ